MKHKNKTRWMNKFCAGLLKLLQLQVIMNGGGKPTQPESLGLLIYNRWHHFNQDQRNEVRSSLEHAERNFPLNK